MEPPVRTDSESMRDEKVKVLKAIPPLEAKNLVRGQFRGYRKEKGVAPDSQVETFAALRLEVDSWRWQGVPFYIRAGKCLPVTCTEVVVRLRQPPTVFPTCSPAPNYCPVPHQPRRDHRVRHDSDGPGGEDDRPAGGTAWRAITPPPEEMDAYERVLGDAMAGDATLFAREDYVEEAWRIVDPVLKAGTPVYEYEPNTWGPGEVDEQVVARRRLAEPGRGRLNWIGDAAMKIEVLPTPMRSPAGRPRSSPRKPGTRSSRAAGSSWPSAADTRRG